MFQMVLHLFFKVKPFQKSFPTDMEKNLLNEIELFLIAKVCMPKPSINQPPYNLSAQAIFLTQTQPFESFRSTLQ